MSLSLLLCKNIFHKRKILLKYCYSTFALLIASYFCYYTFILMEDDYADFANLIDAMSDGANDKNFLH